MSDGETDIRLLALRRQQERRQSIRGRVSSGEYEATPIKEYNRTDSARSRRNSYAEVNTPRQDDDLHIGRMHVPPVIICECNGTEAFAHISSSEPVSTMSANFVRKLRVQDQVVPETCHVFDTFSSRELKGKVKYIDLSIGSSWQQVAQFNIVENPVTDITLGIDFLRKTQSVLNFEDSSIVVGGSRGERIPFLNSREVMFLARRINANNKTLFNGNRNRELL